MTTTHSDDENRAKVREMISAIPVAIMTTMDEQARFRGRPMRTQKPDADGRTLWFFTRTDSPKVDELKQDPRVLLGYSDQKNQDYVAIFGQGKIVTDAARKRDLWSDDLATWLPEGPDSAEVALIAVEIEGAEYWDGVSSNLKFAFGYAQAKLSGKPMSGGENAKVSFA
jgi:general stress protein 26